MHNDIHITVASAEHEHFAEAIAKLIEAAAHKRGTGIAKRSPAYLADKMAQGNAVIALTSKGALAGFCYIETWENEQYLANSGLIVHPDHRGKGLANRIKREVFKLSRRKYPHAKIFGITTSLAVMRINANMGYQPVTFSELTSDEKFWKGCQGCVNYDILQRNNKQNCLCTGMLYDPNQAKAPESRRKKERSLQLFYRWVRLKKQAMLGRKQNKQVSHGQEPGS